MMTKRASVGIEKLCYQYVKYQERISMDVLGWLKRGRRPSVGSFSIMGVVIGR